MKRERRAEEEEEGENGEDGEEEDMMQERMKASSENRTNSIDRISLCLFYFCQPKN